MAKPSKKAVRKAASDLASDSTSKAKKSAAAKVLRASQC